MRKENPNILALFNGDLAEGTSLPDQIRSDFLFQAMQDMNYDVWNLGEKEFLYGWEYLQTKIAENPIFISANLMDAKTQKPVLPGYVIKPIPVQLDGKKEETLNVAVVGVMGSTIITPLQAYLKSDSTLFTINSPSETLIGLMPELRKKSDLVVVLAHMSPSEADQLAKDVAGIDILIFGHVQMQMVANPRLIGRTITVVNGDRGRYAGALELRFDKEKHIANYRGKENPLSTAIPDDPDMLQLIDAYKKTIGGRPVKSTGDSSTYIPKYVGSESCKSCHMNEYKVWKDSPHAGAFARLIQKKETNNAECLKCHTLGFTMRGGFESEEKTPQLAGVHCESCHNPGAMHIQASFDKLKTTIVRTRGQGTCIQCHDVKNDPDFNYDIALEKIKHWK